MHCSCRSVVAIPYWTFKAHQQLAWNILENTRIVSVWESLGARTNIVGSLKTGLLMKNRDIDCISIPMSWLLLIALL